MKSHYTVYTLLRGFNRRDAMLAGTAWACVPVSVSVRHKSVFYRNGLTNRAGFGTGASFHLSYITLNGNSPKSPKWKISKNKGTSFWNFVPKSGLIKILLRNIDRRNVLLT